MKKRFAGLLLAAVIMHSHGTAQTESSCFSATGRGGTATSFATDYQAIGINPANLGFPTDYHIGLGIFEFGFSFHSEALVKDDVRKILFNNEGVLTDSEQVQIARDFAENGFDFDAAVTPVAVSFKLPAGALALGYDVKTSYHSRLSESASGLIFEGYNFADYFDTIIVTPDDTFGISSHPLSLSELTEGTDISFVVRSEINLAYGLKLFGTDAFSVFAGIGMKYVMAHAYFDFHSQDGIITGVSALGLNLLTLNDSITPSDLTTNSLQPVGKGFGFDIGGSARVGDAITVSASIIDIGKIHYTANVLEFHDALLDTVSFSGVNSTDPVQIIRQILKNENVIDYDGEKEFDAPLPTVLRMGAGLKATDFFTAGVDFVLPLNDAAGSFPDPVLGVGAQVKLGKVIKLSAGISTGGGYGLNVPAGFGLDFKYYEFGIASRDVLTLFGQARPTVSLAMGVLRFKI